MNTPDNELALGSAIRELHPGTSVYTADGERIGEVADTDQTYIKVAAPMQRDYWINIDYVLRADTERVELSFHRRDLNAYKMREPTLDEAVATNETDMAISADERQEQRIRMELELARQRQELPHEHPDAEGDAPPTTPGTMGTVGTPVEEELERMDVDWRSAVKDGEASREERDLTGARPQPPAERSQGGKRGEGGTGPMLAAAGGVVWATVLGVAALLLLRRRRR
jgi:hypothetical protein